MRDLLLLDGVCEGGSISQCLIFSVTSYSASPALIERVGDDGRRGESTQNSRALYTTIERVQREFVVAACRVLEIELGPFPEQIGTGWTLSRNKRRL